jgi:hypothetical protein
MPTRAIARSLCALALSLSFRPESAGPVVAAGAGPDESYPGPAIGARLADPELKAFAGALRPQFAYELDRHADATRYSLNLTIDPHARTVIGEQVTRYVNRDRASLPDIVLRLFPNTGYFDGHMRLARVAVDGEVVSPTAYTRNGFPDPSAVVLALREPLAPAESLRIDARFVISAPLDSKAGYTTFGMIDGIFALPNAYAMIPPRDEYGWRADIAPGFGDIVQSESSLFRVTIRAPSDYVVVATGACLDSVGSAASGVRATTCTAGPVRDFAIHLSSRYEVLTGTMTSDTGGDVTVRTFFTPQRKRAGANALTYATDALQTFERRFGAYPFNVLNVFESPSVAGGIEYPMAVGVNASKYQSDGGYFEWIVAHEVAHQWWYGLVGSDPINEAWLDEALAQYSASLYVEDRHGLAVAQAERQRFFYDRYAAEARVRGDERAAQPSGAFYRWTYSPIIYGEAPLFFEDVRREAGDARFSQWLRRYFENNRFGIAQARDLLAVADAAGLGRIVREAYQRRILSR